MKKLLMLVLPLVAAFALTTSAYAVNMYTLTPTQLFPFIETEDSPAGVATLISSAYSGGGVWYKVLFNDDAQQFRHILLGDSTPPLADLTGYTHYGLYFENKDNNDPVKVRVYLEAGVSNTRYYSNWVDLSVTPTGASLLDLNSLGSDINDVREIGLGIQYYSSAPGINPGEYQGDLTNVLVRPIPEPGSMMLLGMGILGLFGLKRKAKV